MQNYLSRMHQLLFRPFLCKKLARHAMTSTASKRAIPSKDSQSRKVIEPEAYMVKEKRDFVVQNIKRVVSDQTRKLFAVIYIQNVSLFYLNELIF